MPVIAPKFSEIDKLSPVQAYQMDVLTVAPNLAGIPMVSVPAGSARSMPVGLHLMSDHLQEGKLIEIASAFESVVGSDKK
jgi:aspartyl-tRNA(Asn)/glutamyl-tRNA(Gln) amidotransferase subunit A